MVDTPSLYALSQDIIRAAEERKPQEFRYALTVYLKGVRRESGSNFPAFARTNAEYTREQVMTWVQYYRKLKKKCSLILF